MDELMKTKLEKETARCITLEETILVLEKRISKLVHWEAECIKFKEEVEIWMSKSKGWEMEVIRWEEDFHALE